MHGKLCNLNWTEDRVDPSRVELSWVIAATQSLVININWAWKSSERMRTKSPKITHNKDELIKRSNARTIVRSIVRSIGGDEKIDGAIFFVSFVSLLFFFYFFGSGLWHPIKKRNWVRRLLILSARDRELALGRRSSSSLLLSVVAFLI